MAQLESFPKKIISASNQFNLADIVAAHLECELEKRLNLYSPKPIGLATGRTMVPVYHSLVKRILKWNKSKLDRLLREWISFNLDEYIGLPGLDQRSFKSYMKKYLADPIGLDLERVRMPDSLASDPNHEAIAYSKEITEKGGIGLQLLGLGSNGHIGFNEPPCSFNCSCRVEALSMTTRKQNAFAFDNDFKNVPEEAITLGLKEILAAEEIHLIVTGIEKVRILRKLLHSECSPNLPASWLKLHPNVFIWADKEALF